MQQAAVKPEAHERRLKRAMAVENMRTKFAPLLKTKCLPTRAALWGNCVRDIGSSEHIALLEFGVFKGRSMAFWSQNFVNPESRFYGFDSFEGLPEDWTGRIIKGTFSTGGAVPTVDDARVSFHKGWLQNTLPAFLETLTLPDNCKLVVHVDVDLYSAALFALTTLWHHVPEYFVIFDEFSIEENLALANFSSAYPVKIDFYSHTFNEEVRLPRQVFGRIVKTVYAPPKS